MRLSRHSNGGSSRHQHPLAYIALFLVLALGALAIVVATHRSTDTGSGGTPGPDNAFDCPRGQPQGFSLSDVEGRSLEEVEDWARAKGITVRVVVKDGEPMAATMDYRSDRVNTQVEAGVVTRYCGNY
jgi:hypothetical protein